MDTKLLRQKILDLAIRGKLVPQDHNDEPASVLLERIKAEKEQLIKAGKIKCPKKAATTSDSRHYPFELPDGWVWCRLVDLTSVVGDGLHGTPQYNPNGAYYFVNGNNLSNRKILIKDSTKRVSKEEYIKYKKPLNEHTILVSINGTIGNVATYSNEQIILGKSVCYFNITPFLVKEYMCYVIESNYFQKYALLSATGSTIKNVPLKAINEFNLPIPPVSEQKRIVSQIDYLLDFIYKVESGKLKLQDTIKQVKRKILDLAIHGKLVPQDPTDEPASELLKQVNPSAEITCDNEHNRKLRQGWCSLTVNDICTIIGGVSYNKADIQYKGIRVLRGGNIHNSRIIDCSDDVFLPISYQNDDNQVQQGDIIVVASTGSKTLIGKTGFADRDIPKTQIGAFLRIVRPKQKALSPFLRLIFQTDNYKDYIRNVAKGSNINNVKNAHLQKYQISLPPLAEQQRIVSKIEELFAQLDTIANSLQV